MDLGVAQEVVGVEVGRHAPRLLGNGIRCNRRGRRARHHRVRCRGHRRLAQHRLGAAAHATSIAGTRIGGLLAALAAAAELADQPHHRKGDDRDQDQVGQEAQRGASQAEVRQQPADTQAGGDAAKDAAPVALGGRGRCRAGRPGRGWCRLLCRLLRLLRGRGGLGLLTLGHRFRLLANAARAAHALGLGVERHPDG
ncbi:hypothetical protein D9M68_720740 [compost metagenome]